MSDKSSKQSKTLTPKILAFAGSARQNSYNMQLLKIAVAGARAAGAEVTIVNLGDYPMPLFDADSEVIQGEPPAVQRLRTLLDQHDGMLIAAPEYNGSLTPLLKNTIDWLSRPVAGAPHNAVFKNKVAALISASPAKLGGLRGLSVVAQLLTNIGVLVLPNTIAVGDISNALTESGDLLDPMHDKKVKAVGSALAVFLERFIRTA